MCLHWWFRPIYLLLSIFLSKWCLPIRPSLWATAFSALINFFLFQWLLLVIPLPPLSLSSARRSCSIICFSFSLYLWLLWIWSRLFHLVYLLFLLFSRRGWLRYLCWLRCFILHFYWSWLLRWGLLFNCWFGSSCCFEFNFLLLFSFKFPQISRLSRLASFLLNFFNHLDFGLLHLLRLLIFLTMLLRLFFRYEWVDIIAIMPAWNGITWILLFYLFLYPCTYCFKFQLITTCQIYRVNWIWGWSLILIWSLVGGYSILIGFIFLLLLFLLFIFFLFLLRLSYIWHLLCTVSILIGHSKAV